MQLGYYFRLPVVNEIFILQSLLINQCQESLFSVLFQQLLEEEGRQNQNLSR